ncbi:hypothetical protein [Ectobacillus ponti]|uniref:Uncharacterized protein n=1 Tax=Ectobacillus ponti TaxID=2961894 RepID=A0AA42BTL3_9BACI|nr:hypothetical protein [Ectobacillus ponti]MCP8969598.1 hypothetical protein [Ectobacillus ponti]
MNSEEKRRRPLGTPGQRNQRQYQMDLPPVNFQKNNNLASNPHTDDLRTDR